MTRSKEGSWVAANAWWRKKLAELTHTPRPESAIATWVAVQQYLATGKMPVVGVDLGDGEVRYSFRGLQEQGEELGRRAVEVIDNTLNNTVPADTRPDTNGALSRQWIERETERCRTGQMKPRTLSNNKVNVNHFVEFVGGSRTPVSIDEATLDRYYGKLLKVVGAGGLSASNARARMGTAVRFVRWLWEQRKIELPRNLDGEWRFGGTAGVILTFTKEEIHQLLTAATVGQNRLHVLLMLNCGMYPTDIAAHRDDEVDWVAGRIIRKRSKTRTHATVPTVSYPLWPETLRLLREHRCGGEIVLLNARGRPWMRESVTDDGKVKFTDVISVSLDDLWKRAGMEKPVKSLRKTGATLLESSAEFARFVGLYLGHAPRGMAEVHYAGPDRAGFDRAIDWLGEKLGITRHPGRSRTGPSGD